MVKSAIVVLTRGYINMHDYKDLVTRNINISKNLNNKEIEILIFHEGNIIEMHQKFISKFTPLLKLIFIDISEKAFLKKNVDFYGPTKQFNLNYRHMCSFWFVDFWNYVEDYELILRIDEDCNINFSIDSIFLILNWQNKVAVFGNWVRDQEFVTTNLNTFTMQFLKENALNQNNDLIIQSHRASGPYTNVLGLNLTLLKQNVLLQKYIAKVKESDNIYKYRWGDLPLWGEALFYFYNPASYSKLNISYFHGSHNTFIGKSNKIKLII